MTEAVVALAAGCGTLLAVATPALASGSSPPSSPSPSASPAVGAPAPPDPTPTRPPYRPASPTITTPSSGEFVSGSITIEGTRDEADQVQLFAGSNRDTPICIVDRDGTTTWSCPGMTVPSGANVNLHVVATGDAARASDITVASLSAPTVSANGDAVLSNGLVRGTAYPGSNVTARLSSGASCSFQTDASGAWACVLRPGTPDGRYRLSVTATGGAGFPGGASVSADPLDFVLDTTPPPAPTITAPTAGARLSTTERTTYSGTGEDGASVSVWAGTSTGSTRVCSTTVSQGSWSCQGDPLAPGQYSLSAIALDAAGNASPGSATLRLSAEAGDTSSATPTPRSSAAPGSSSPSPSQPPGSSGASPSAQPPSGSSSGAVGGATPLTLSPFTSAVQSVTASSDWSAWLRAAVSALVALLLLAVPARMLAASFRRARGSAARRTGRLFGRNRGRHEYEQPTEPTAARPWAVGAAGLVAAAAMVSLSGSVADQGTYLRLIPAILLALLVVGAVAVAAPWATARRMPGVSIRFAFTPYTLLFVAGATVFSRLLDLQPALLYGVIVMITAITGSRQARGRIAAVQLLALTVLAAAAWFLIGVLPQPATVATAFVGELVNAVVLLSIGSAGILLLPLGPLPGRAVFQWSRGIWLLLAVAIDTVLFAILVPAGAGGRSTAGSTVFALCTMSFAAASASVWLWQRYIAPALR